jgi:beta-glucosidase
MTLYSFPDDFLWGSATASYQIEGAAQEDGRGESIWDRFSHTPGKVKNGDTGDVACDHYHRWREDIALMKSLGLRNYRFSIAWPRIFPEGRGRIEPRGVDFYNRLVDELLANDITPFATLYHWDLPQTLQDEGGWGVRSTATAFADYADVVTRALGDRVKNWITINEPWCVSLLSHFIGVHAPGLQDGPLALRAAHHSLLAHGLAVPVLRANSPGAAVAITLNYTHPQPATVAPAPTAAADYNAARLYDGFFNRWFFDPVHGRDYPADMVTHYAKLGFLPNGMEDFVRPGDMEIIAAPTDFLGVNYYSREVVKAGNEGMGWENAPEAANLPRTAIGWEVYPDGLYNLLCRLHFDYQTPKIIVTENGVSYPDGPGDDGKIHDAKRIEYLRSHFAAVARARAAGAPVAGYFVWSLMDNFEWAEGSSQRFGAVWVNYETQQRTPKESAHFVTEVMQSNAVEE